MTFLFLFSKWHFFSWIVDVEDENVIVCINSFIWLQQFVFYSTFLYPTKYRAITSQKVLVLLLFHLQFI